MSSIISPIKRETRPSDVPGSSRVDLSALPVVTVNHQTVNPLRRLGEGSLMSRRHHLKSLLESLVYRPPTKLRVGKIFSRVCLTFRSQSGPI